jgi:hypothetical protein
VPDGTNQKGAVLLENPRISSVQKIPPAAREKILPGGIFHARPLFETARRSSAFDPDQGARMVWRAQDRIT